MRCSNLVALLIVLGGWCVFVAKRAKVQRTPFKVGAALRALKGAFWEAILPLVIFGLMYSTPHLGGCRGQRLAP